MAPSRLTPAAVDQVGAAHHIQRQIAIRIPAVVHHQAVAEEVILLMKATKQQSRASKTIPNWRPSKKLMSNKVNEQSTI